ncbi:unnamed protein product [Phytophthora fragariaefolia]|uniref:Unnamed protein product n=1 Tax=Phytophthora fragariaefolia TaxID=1490495 RepID=A0A9W6TL64_9STRA|nr:unnamed protein product [Phytophthora fragariaefolia]
MEAHRSIPEHQSTAAQQQELQPSSAPELPPPSDPEQQSTGTQPPCAPELPPATPHEPQTSCTPEQQLSSVSSLHQDAPTDVEPDLASVDSQPLFPPLSRSFAIEELADSNDEDWSTAESAEEDEEVTADSEGDDSAEADISINLIDVNVNQKVTRLIKADNCERRCMQGKTHELEYLVCSVSQMTKSEKLTSVYSMIGVLMQTDTVQRSHSKGEQEKFNYYLSFVGAMCHPSFARYLDLTPLTILRYKTRVQDGNIATMAHGNLLNKNASTVDIP